MMRGFRSENYGVISRLLALMLMVVCLSTIITIPSVSTADVVSKGVTITGSTVVAVGKSVTLKANKKVTWESSNKKIATVSQKGVVKGKKAGSVKITATAKDGSKKTWKMTVKAKAVRSIKITAPTTELDLNGTATVKLKAKASPAAAAQSFTWKSSNEKIATVSSSGKVTAHKVGTVKITAKADDGSGVKETIKLTVKDSTTQREKIGISMPTDWLQRWVNDGTGMRDQLKKAGYDVVLEYADNDVDTQISQIEGMISDGCQTLIIAAVSDSSLSDVLAKAKAKGIYVVAYDKLIRNSDAVSYYVTFDNEYVGKLQANYIIDKLNLDSSEGPFYIEITAGPSGDYNALQFYSGAARTLSPYFASGKLVTRSGQSAFADVGTPGWQTEAAQERATDILITYYADGTNVDAWLCSNDSTALGVTYALDDCYAGSWPIVTGQDCDRQNVRNIIAGKQSMSVFKDTRTLVNRTVTMVKAIMNGISVETTGTSNNNAINVPSYLCKAVVVDRSNYHEYLIETGFYTEDELN